jgi:hypothetical protein
VVRFREQTDGRVRQRSILCGDAVLAERARALIRSWRRAAFTPARERERLGRLVCSLVAEARHYSRRQRRSLLQQAQAAAEDPRKALLFAYRMQYPDELVRSRKRIGRPPRGRLF